jgi:hypothetical protein
LIAGPLKLDRHALAFDKAGLTQAFAELRDQRRKLFGRTMMEKSNDRHRRLLRARHERPCGCCAAEKRYELAPFQLIELHSVSASTAFGRYRIGRD